MTCTWTVGFLILFHLSSAFFSCSRNLNFSANDLFSDLHNYGLK
jgi:hypothetical protein